LSFSVNNEGEVITPIKRHSVAYIGEDNYGLPHVCTEILILELKHRR